MDAKLPPSVRNWDPKLSPQRQLQAFIAGAVEAAARVLRDIRRDAREAEQLRDDCFEEGERRRAAILADLIHRIEALEAKL